MINIPVGDRTHNLLKKNEDCPLCGKNLEDVAFTWGISHGNASSSCCNANFQIKSYHIENPTTEEKKLLEMLDGDFIELNVKSDWIIPLQKAFKKTGIKDCKNAGVIKTAEEFIKNNVDYLKDNESVTSAEIKQDIKDTEDEIKGYEQMKLTEPFKARIYDMQISSRREFIKKIKRILDLRGDSE